MLIDKDLLSICLQEIERSLNWGGADSWNNQDFEDLSDKIFENTAVRLSVSTLKRIWGRVKYDSQPTPATLNALAVYLGYTNWKEYRTSKQAENMSTANEVENFVTREPGENTILEKKSVFSTLVRNSSSLRNVLIVVVIVPILIYFLTGFNQQNITASDRSVAFTSLKLSDDLPNTVVFTYDLKGIEGDSFFIQQNWDPKRREKISPIDNKHTSIYFYPGNFTARLIVNNRIVKTSRVFIQTKGWKGIIQQSPLPVYLSTQDINLSSGLGVEATILKEKTGSSVFNNIVTQFDNVREFDSLRLSEFEFETTLQNTSTVEQALCRKVTIEILGIGTAIIVPFADRGCSSILNLMPGDTMFYGKNTDLSRLGLDFSKPHRLNIKVENQTLIVRVDGEEVFKRPNQKVDVPLVGLRFMFEGAGVVHNVSIGRPGEKATYAENFQRSISAK